MAYALAATRSSTPSVRAQLNLYQAQLQQARREAAQAQDRVARLEQQTQAARREAERAQGRLQDLQNNPPPTPATDNGLRRRINTLSQLSGSLLDVTV
jgi:chromosome segregation ATPase